MWPPCLTSTEILASSNDKSDGLFTTPGLTSSSNGENCIVLLFSERPIASIYPVEFSVSVSVLLSSSSSLRNN